MIRDAQGRMNDDMIHALAVAMHDAWSALAPAVAEDDEEAYHRRCVREIWQYETRRFPREEDEETE